MATERVVIEGSFGDVTFALTGPPDKLSAITKYIRNLQTLMENTEYVSGNYKVKRTTQE